MIDFIKQLKKDKEEIYKRDYHEMISAYNREIETTRGYNGRQLLELLQNCDDQESSQVVIKIIPKKRKLIISNQGVPFSEEGYRSLTTSNLSSKVIKSAYIGNKGLGFRSILNWCVKVDIYSNGIKVSYSEKARRDAFERLFDQKTRNEIRQKYNIGKKEYPTPVLTVPKVSNSEKHTQFATSIVLRYREEFLDDIYKQIDDLKPETILFLNHVTSINFEGFPDKEDIIIQRENKNLLSNSCERIVTNDNVWDIYLKEGDIPKDLSQESEEAAEKFQIKLAVPRNEITRQQKLYSHFATNISLDFPFIVHGTFDLESNRKYLDDSTKNRFVLKKLAKFIYKIGCTKKVSPPNWNTFKFLKYRKTNENLSDLEFYTHLDKILNEKEIAPSTDGSYVALNNAVYISENFANLILTLNDEGIFFRHLKPFPEGYNEEDIDVRYNQYSDFVKFVNNWSSKIEDTNKRVKLIKFLVDYYKGKDQILFDVFVNEQNKIIPSDAEVFTHITNDYSIPTFCNIQVLNGALFKSLCSIYKIDEGSKKDNARALQSKLKQIGKVFSFEFLDLSRKIVSNTWENIEDKPETTTEAVKSMISSLFNNYDVSTNTTSLGIQNVPIIDYMGMLRNAQESFFSSDYNKGKLCYDIFDELHTKRIQIASPNYYGIIEENYEDFEKFMEWLGVNSFVKYQRAKITSLSHPFVRRILNNYSATSVNFQVLNIDERDKIFSNLNVEKLILWLINDKRLSKSCNVHEGDHKDEFNFYYRTNRKAFSNQSFLSWKISQTVYNFEGHLLESAFQDINETKIDYSHNLFKKYNVKRSQIESILRNLGAAADFNDIDIKHVYNILKKVNKISKNGRNTSSYYKRAYQHYEENNSPLPGPLKLYASNGFSKELFDQQDIFFSDKINIPKKLQEDFPIFNFPKRSGGKKAIEFFKINDLEELKINIDSFTKNNSLNDALKSFLSPLYPHFLIHRISVLDNEKTKRTETRRLLNLNIICCSHVVAVVDDKSYELEDYEFIFLKNEGYLLKLPDDKRIKELIRQSKFKDVLSEILSHLFDVSRHKNDFRAIINSDIDDVIHISKENFGEDLLDETLNILGFSTPRISFWNTIYRIKGLELEFQHKEKELKLDKINRDLEISLTEDLPNYLELNNAENKRYLHSLFSFLDVSIREFNKLSSVEIDYKVLYENQLTSIFFNEYNLFRNAIHQYCMAKNIQEEFLQKLHDLEFNQNKVIKSFSRKRRYEFALKGDTVLEIFKRKHFNDYNLMLDDYINIDNIFLSNYGNLEDYEKDHVNSNLELKSKLYFKISLDEVKKEILALKEENERTTVSEPKINLKPIDSKSSKPQRMSNAKTKILSGNKSRKKIFNPSNGSERNNKRIGTNSEVKVYNYLCDEYGAEYVQYKSRDDEGLHYDIRYSRDKGESYLYVEVKTFSNNSIIISREEFEFGIEKNQSYELWLVKGDDLIVYDNPLESLKTTVKEYYVIFDAYELIPINS